MKYAFAGNRDIGVEVLKFITKKGYYPDLLMITNRDTDVANEMIRLSKLDDSKIIVGRPDKEQIVTFFEEERPDYIFGIHYPYIIGGALLELPKIGFLNLHPAYLPYNRGWHTPSWAILENTPIGATLHFMSEQLDMGAIMNRKKIEIDPADTADSLYQKLKKLEIEVFKESFDDIIKKEFDLTTQVPDEGTSHRKKDLFSESIQYLELNKEYEFESLINKLRALTTNDISEAAYFVKNGKKYRIQIKICEDFGSTNE